MSLKKFSELFGDLDSVNSTNNKIKILKIKTLYIIKKITKLF